MCFAVLACIFGNLVSWLKSGSEVADARDLENALKDMATGEESSTSAKPAPPLSLLQKTADAQDPQQDAKPPLGGMDASKGRGKDSTERRVSYAQEPPVVVEPPKVLNDEPELQQRKLLDGSETSYQDALERLREEDDLRLPETAEALVNERGNQPQPQSSRFWSALDSLDEVELLLRRHPEALEGEQDISGQTPLELLRERVEAVRRLAQDFSKST